MSVLLISVMQVQYATVPFPRVSAWLMLPFLLLLLAIAVLPAVNHRWWHRHYPKVALGLGFAVFAYYSVYLDYHRMVDTLLEYFSFIVLIGSLFVAASGLFIHAERRASPVVNAGLLAVGALVSNLLGTTGASMLLIRPFFRMNRARIRRYHVVFFIFVVSNIGGGLTPIGDPPLLLGYLNGVPFFWTVRHMFLPWLFTVTLVLAVFYVIDARAYRKWVLDNRPAAATARFELKGRRSILFLAVILAAVFGRTPVREFIMIATAAAAYRLARKDAMHENAFSFEPIREVAILFAGIFATMVPALDWLAVNTGKLGLSTPGAFFWASGTLSSVLDNAPTYLSFLSAALGLHGLRLGDPAHIHALIAEHGKFLQAISAGSVFFGAGTYIGNGPNFLVKTIAEHGKIECPSFFGYVFKYSLPVLIPIYTLVWIVFFR